MKKSLVIAPAVAAALTGLGAPLAFAQTPAPSEAPASTEENASEAEAPAPEESSSKEEEKEEAPESESPAKAPAEDASESSSKEKAAPAEETREADALSTGAINGPATITADEVAAGFPISVTNESTTSNMRISFENTFGNSSGYRFVDMGQSKDFTITDLKHLADKFRAEGGTITVRGTWLADDGDPSITHTITVLPDAAATPTDSPSPTPTETSSPAPTDTDSPTPTETASPSPTDTSSPTPTDTGSPSPTDTGSPTPSNSPDPGDDDDDDRRSISITPERISPEDFVKEQAVTIAVTGCEPGADATVRVTPDGFDDVTGHTETRTVGDDGTVRFGVRDGYEGTYNVVVECAGGDALRGQFTVGDPAPPSDDDDDDDSRPGEDDSRPGDDRDDRDDRGDDSDEAPARALAITPERISPADFVKEEAVSITASGCTPGTDAVLTVTPAGSSGVTGHTDTQTVGEDGTVTFGVRGLNADSPQSYVGTYQVRVECDGGDALTGEFVVGDPSRGGSDDDRGAGDDDGSTLPRTGGELSGLGVGAALLVIGGATLLVTRRRGTGASPTDV